MPVAKKKTKKEETPVAIKKTRTRKPKAEVIQPELDSLQKALVGIPKPKKATKPNEQLQETLGQFLTMTLPEMLAEFDTLPTNKKWDYLLQLLPYATPKMQSSEVKGTVGITPLQQQLGNLANEYIEDEQDDPLKLEE